MGINNVKFKVHIVTTYLKNINYFELLLFFMSLKKLSFVDARQKFGYVFFTAEYESEA